MSFINLSKVTEAAKEQLKNNAVLISKKAIVKRGEYINMDPDLAVDSPWIGVYKSTAVYDPRTLGQHSQSWDGLIALKIVVQAAHGADGSKCEERLADWEAKTLDALWADPTLGGTVDMLVDMSAEYSYEETKSESLYFQWVTLTITARLSTG